MSTRANKDKIRTVMREFKRGELKSSSGDTVTSLDQARAIALSEQRRANKSSKRSS